MATTVAVRLNAITGEFEKAFTSATRTVSGFERAFGSAASSLQGHQQKLNAAFSQFSGDKLIQEAHQYSAAITKVGGATKLTASEQQRVNAVVTEAIAKYKALGETAPKALTDLANATKQIEQPLSRTQQAVGFLQSTFAQFTAANLAASAIQNVVGKLGEFAAQGAKLPGLQASFKNLAQGIGQDSERMLSTLQDATRGMVTNIDLMQSANKAMLLGLPVTTESMGELAKAATVLGKAMGQDATKSLDDLITALGRSSPLILDNLGLTVKVGEANEAYAARLGKTVEQLTDAERKTAFYEAAMEKARQKVTELGEQTKTLGEFTQTAWVSIGNVVTETVAEVNTGIGAMITYAIDGFGDINDSIREFLNLRREASTVQSEATDQDEGWRDGLKATRTELILYSMGLYSVVQALREAKEETKAAEIEQSNYNRALANAPKAVDVFGRRNDANANQFGRDLLDVTKYLKDYEKGLEDAKRAQEAYTKSVNALRDQLSGNKLGGEVKRLADAWRGLTREQRETPEVLKRTADAALELYRNGARLTPELFAIVASTGRLSDLLPSVRTGLQGIDQSFLTMTRVVSSGSKELLEFINLLNHPNLKTTLGLPSTVPGLKLPKPEPPEIPPPTFGQKFKEQLKDVGLEFVNDVSTALADAIRTGDWSQITEQLEQAVANAIAFGVSAAIDLAVPGLGTALRPLIQAFSEKFVALFDRNKGRDLVEDFANSLGGFDALQKRLQEMGAEGERLWIKLTQGVGRNNPEQAAAAIREVEAALAEFGTEAERAQRRLDSLGVAVAGVNDRAALFAAPFQKLTDAIKEADGSELESLQNKLLATAQAGQAEFERLGQFAGAAFAGIVNESGDAIGALKQLEPALKILQQGVNEFGLSSTATIDQLLGAFALVNDETFGPILSAIQATGQIFQGLSEAGYMTAELFQTVASDIGASFRDLEAKGGDVSKALALSQPVLQRLWEAQQLYGEVTDETTAKLLKQAEEQGLVGAHMKDVNKQILDVLVAIADVFGAQIPDAIRMTTTAGQEAARKLKKDFGDAANGIKSEFDGIRLNPLKVDIEYNDPGFTPRTKTAVAIEDDGSPRLVALAEGGVVRRPTLALVGEAGPEAVIPLSQFSSGFPQAEGGNTTVILEIDGRSMAEATVPHIPGVVRRYGLV